MPPAAASVTAGPSPWKSACRHHPPGPAVRREKGGRPARPGRADPLQDARANPEAQASPPRDVALRRGRLAARRRCAGRDDGRGLGRGDGAQPRLGEVCLQELDGPDREDLRVALVVALAELRLLHHRDVPGPVRHPDLGDGSPSLRRGLHDNGERGDGVEVEPRGFDLAPHVPLVERQNGHSKAGGRKLSLYAGRRFGRDLVGRRRPEDHDDPPVRCRSRPVTARRRP